MIAEAPTKKKVFLFNDTATYNTHKRKEDAVFKAFDKLVDVYRSCISTTDEIDYKALVEYSEDYILKSYWEKWGKQNAPGNADPLVVFETFTKVNISTVTDYKHRFQKDYDSMQVSPPTITKSGLKSNLKQSQFDKYLSDDKANEYNALNNFLDAMNELEVYGSGSQIKFVGFHPALRIDGLNLIINKHNFI